MLKMMFKRFPLMDADDGLDISNVETSEEMEDAADLPDEPSEETEEVADPSPSDSAFAQMRREKAELERRIAELESSVSEYDETLGLFFDGEDKIAQAYAHANDTTAEEERQRLNAVRHENEMSAENEELRSQIEQLEYEKLKAEDLSEINSLEGVNLGDIDELGDLFKQARMSGMSPTDAYFFVQSRTPKAPKPMGKVASGGKPDKNFFTSEEVDKMSKAEVKANFDKIRASMSKW